MFYSSMITTVTIDFAYDVIKYMTSAFIVLFLELELMARTQQIQTPHALFENSLNCCVFSRPLGQWCKERL